jgi:pimeloyl-ACP methyl ester carboxylesterase
VKLGSLTTGRFLIALAGAVFLIHLGYQTWNDWRLSKPGFHERNCWFDTEVVGDARCGFFTVPENRQDPQTRTIRLPVVIFQAAEPEAPSLAPVFYLTGGPGGQAYLGPDEVLEVWAYDLEIFPSGHDLIVMGQRGTGLGKADFDCEEFNTPALGWGAFRPGEEPPDYPPLLVEAARSCAARLLEAGIDLSAYNSRESAADIAELRLALGIPEWNLYGISYGTRLALSTLRYHPEGIRAVVLDSVFPPEAADLPDTAAFFRRALARVFADCREDPECTDDYGDIEDAYHRAAAWLSAEPQTVAIDDIVTPDERELLHDLAGLPEDSDLVVSFDHRLLDYLILDALFTAEARGSIPELIGETATRQLAAMKRHTGEMMIRYSWYDLSSAVFLSHSCRDEAPFDSSAAVAAAIAAAGMQGHIIDESMAYLLCGDWPSGRAEAVEGTAVVSPVPALLLAGSYDPVTPPSLARTAAENLPNGHVFELTEASHGVVYESACARRLLAWFLENLARPPESLCSDWEIAGTPGAPKSAEISR